MHSREVDGNANELDMQAWLGLLWLSEGGNRKTMTERTAEALTSPHEALPILRWVFAV